MLQDLPNYAQHTVPIFSLPQEWLWCESWCGNATKSKAKTIDLCNNPMTKEPKLQVDVCSFGLCCFPYWVRTPWPSYHCTFFFSVFWCAITFPEFYWILQGARRIVSEWPDLDLEARQFTAKILGDELDVQEPTPLPNQSEKSVIGSPAEDLESRAELWI